MKYTKERPTQVGWYWMKSFYGYEKIYEIVQYNLGWEGLTPSELIVKTQWKNLLITNKMFKDVLWAGPINPPTEANVLP